MIKLFNDAFNSYSYNYKEIFNLNQNDPYTLESIEDLQNQRFIENLEYYVCVVKEFDQIYLLDAESVIEDYIKHKVIKNPYTRKEIEDFEVFFSSKEDREFKFYMNKSAVLQKPHHLPIFWNSPKRPISDRTYYLTQYAEELIKSDKDKAINAYKKAVEYGSVTAKLKLAKFYIESGNADLAIGYLKASIESEDIYAGNAFFCGRCLDDLNRKDLALNAYSVSAQKGNCIGMAEIIHRFEKGIGIEIDLSRAKKWRQLIPKKWQGSSMEEFCKHLKKINYDYTRTSYP